MIDKELEVGDCIYLSYSTLAHYISDLQLHDCQFAHDHPDRSRIIKGNIDYEQFHDDVDVNGNIYFCVYFVKPWCVCLRDINGSHGEIMLNADFVKGYGEFVKHKKCVIKEAYDAYGEVISPIVTFEDEAEDDERVNVLDAMAESKIKALQEYESEPQSIDDKMKAVEEADANLKATEAKLIAKEAAKVQESVSSDYLDIMAGMMMKDNKVSHPSHYTWLKELCGIEVIDIARHLDFDMGNALKYLLRAGKKSEEGYTDKEKEIQDLKKAVFYIQDKIKMLEEEDERD